MDIESQCKIELFREMQFPYPEIILRRITLINFSACTGNAQDLSLGEIEEEKE